MHCSQIALEASNIFFELAGIIMELILDFLHWHYACVSLPNRSIHTGNNLRLGVPSRLPECSVSAK